MSEYVKLAELVLCQPTGSVENERRFSAMNNIKTPARNRLDTPHLNACMRVAASPHTLADFPFAEAVDLWSAHGRRGVSAPPATAPAACGVL